MDREEFIKLITRHCGDGRDCLNEVELSIGDQSRFYHLVPATPVNKIMERECENSDCDKCRKATKKHLSDCFDRLLATEALARRKKREEDEFMLLLSGLVAGIVTLGDDNEPTRSPNA